MPLDICRMAHGLRTSKVKQLHMYLSYVHVYIYIDHVSSYFPVILKFVHRVLL